jgi:hypothetical protein
MFHYKLSICRHLGWCGVFLASLGTSSLDAQSVMFGWQPSASTNIAEYVIFYGTVSNIYTYSNSVGLATNAIITGLQPGMTYYFVVGDIDTSGVQSEPSGQVAYTVPAADPVISWPNPTNIVFGTPLGTSQLNATANVPGTFAYSPPAGTILSASNAQILSVVFTPQNITNYILATNTVAINVLPAPLTITANDINKVYGAILPSLSASYSGWVNGDTLTSLTTMPNLATTATSSSPFGTYPITASGAVAPNYAIIYVNCLLTIGQSASAVNWSNPAPAYGGKAEVIN